MANEKQVERLKKGVGKWNGWRKNSNWLPLPDLSAADLFMTDLMMADLSGAHLPAANFSKAKLRGRTSTGQ
jgi:uncharacterized protein YjbI with pentapeptide repeats